MFKPQVETRPCGACRGTGEIFEYAGPRTPLGREAMARLEPNERVAVVTHPCKLCGGTGRVPR